MEREVAKSEEITIVSGLAEPSEARMATMVVGIRVTLEVLMAKKVHIASEASLEWPFNSCSSFMAFKPKGVAALPNPKRLALTFMVM